MMENVVNHLNLDIVLIDNGFLVKNVGYVGKTYKFDKMVEFLLRKSDKIENKIIVHTIITNQDVIDYLNQYINEQKG